jgi:ribonuclease P protein component
VSTGGKPDVVRSAARRMYGCVEHRRLSPCKLMVNEPAPRGTNRFPKSRRLLRHSDFERVYKSGKRHFATHMTVFFLRREENNGLRVGFTVGRALGGAVQRNRMKRRLREAVRLSDAGSQLPADVVINPKRSLLTADFKEIQKEIARAVQVIERAIKSV